jgi:hypothetical protein
VQLQEERDAHAATVEELKRNSRWATEAMDARDTAHNRIASLEQAVQLGEDEREGLRAERDRATNLLLGIMWGYAAVTWTWLDEECRDVFDEGLCDALVALGDGVNWWRPRPWLFEEVEGDE